MYKFNIVWGTICLVFAMGAMFFIALVGKPPVFFLLALLPLVVGGNSLHLGLKEMKQQKKTESI